MALSPKNGAVMLDKDGTLLENLPYNVDPQHMRLAPGAAAGLRQLANTGRRLIVISNQPGVAFGYFPETALGVVRDRLAQLFEQQGASLAGFLYCPHHPAGTLPRYAHACTCRKPHSGLLKRAARQFGFCLRHSWMVGDILDDIEAGRRVFCRTILVDCGNETEWRRTPRRIPDYIVGDLLMAARLIVREMQPRQATGIVAAGMVPR